MNTTDTVPPVARTITRKGAGRTKGSFSFVKATMAQLMALNPNPNYQWLLSRTQVQALGGTGFTTDRVSDLKESIAGQSEETKVEVKATEL